MFFITLSHNNGFRFWHTSKEAENTNIFSKVPYYPQLSNINKTLNPYYAHYEPPLNIFLFHAAFLHAALFDFQIEIVGSSMQREAKEYDCCPGELYPSLEVAIQFKKKSYFSKTNELMTP